MIRRPPRSTPGPARVEPKLAATPAPTPPPTPTRTKPPSPRPPTPVVPERPKLAAPKKTAPVSVRETIAVLSAPKTRKRTQRSSRMASGKVRRKPPATRRISAETAGSLVVAAAASLLLAGALGQRLVSAGIAAFLVGLISFVTVEYARGRGHWPGRLDGVLLIAGIVLGLAVWPVGRVAPGPTAAVGVAVSAANPLAFATRRLQHSPPSILLAIAPRNPEIGRAHVWTPVTL